MRRKMFLRVLTALLIAVGTISTTIFAAGAAEYQESIREYVGLWYPAYEVRSLTIACPEGKLQEAKVCLRHSSSASSSSSSLTLVLVGESPQTIREVSVVGTEGAVEPASNPEPESSDNDAIWARIIEMDLEHGLKRDQARQEWQNQQVWQAILLIAPDLKSQIKSLALQLDEQPAGFDWQVIGCAKLCFVEAPSEVWTVDIPPLITSRPPSAPGPWDQIAKIIVGAIKSPSR